MFDKLLLISILDLILGINFLSPIILLKDISENREIVYETEKFRNIPYLLPVTESTYFPIRDWAFADPSINARAAILYDLNSEKVLFSAEPEKKLPIASLTKLMTAVIVIENADLEDTVTVKNSAIEKSKKEGGGSDLNAGEKIKVSDLLKLILIESSNDAAYSLDEHLADKYGISLVEKMNEKAGIIGMGDTLFTEAAGLDDQNSFSTSQDLIKLVKYSFRYDLLYDILKIQKTEVVSTDGRLRHQILNTNQLLGLLFNIIGGKTGFTELAGGSMILVTEAPSGSSRLITIVLGSSDRFSDARRLVEWAEKAYIWK